MAEENATLTTFYKSWKLYQDNLIEAFAPLTPEQLNLRAAPGAHSIGEIVAHVVTARVGWFVGFLGEQADDEVMAMDEWDSQDTPAHSTAELVPGLDRTWQFMADALARWNTTDMQKTFPQEWRGQHYDLSRSWVVWHVLEHDLHHGGEISLTLGSHGLKSHYG